MEYGCVYEGCTAEGTVPVTGRYQAPGGDVWADVELHLCPTHAEVVQGDTIRGVSMENP